MNKRILFLIGFFLLAISVWLQITSIPSIRHIHARLDKVAYDVQLRTKLFTHRLSLDQSPVVIVDIDDKTLKKEGRWPWPRSKVGELISIIQDEGAVIIALDMIFPEPEENIVNAIIAQLNKKHLSSPQINPILEKIKPFFNQDEKFAEDIKKAEVVLGLSFLPRDQVLGEIPKPLLTLTQSQEKNLELIQTYGVIANVPILQQAAKSSGFVNVYADNDGIIRRVPLLIRYKDDVYPSLALEAVRNYLLSNIKLITASYDKSIRLEGISIGDHHIPTDEKAQATIPFVGDSFTLPYFSATDVLHHQIKKGLLEGKIVFLGTSATGLGDLKATPIQSAFPGVEIQATMVYGILTNSFSFKPAWTLGVEVFLNIFFGTICIFLFPFISPFLLSLMLVLIPVLLIIANNELWVSTGLIISILIPTAFIITIAMFNLIYGYLFESKRRERLKTMFGQYVPETHIDEMLKTSSSFNLLGEDREMTVLFSDIRDFTSISEGLTAAQLKEMLNEFFTPMTEIIFRNKGTIDKYVGDMIMAFWGAPLKDKNHIRNAINAALEMQNNVDKLKDIFIKKEWTPISIGIGINTGIMSVGDMGSKFRRNYTVLGDEVNLASRAEGLTKFYGVKIIGTDRSCKDEKTFLFRKLDRVRVKGKKISIEIFEIVGKQKEVTIECRQEVQLSNQALEFYFNKRWSDAKILFSQLNEARPEFKFYSLYLKRIEEYQNTPPPEDWDGVFVHTEK